MTDLRKYLDSGRLTRQRSSPVEIESLFKVVERDLACRARRNTVDYDGIGIASDADVAELIAEARSLREAVETWLADKHGDLLGGAAPM